MWMTALLALAQPKYLFVRAQTNILGAEGGVLRVELCCESSVSFLYAQ